MRAAGRAGHTSDAPLEAKECEMANALTDMANGFMGDVKRAAGWSIALSVLMIAAGLLAIAVPMAAGTAVTVVVGWLLIFSAVLHLAFAVNGGGAGGGGGGVFFFGGGGVARGL